jgi:hypothetical protein
MKIVRRTTFAILSLLFLSDAGFARENNYQRKPAAPPRSSSGRIAASCQPSSAKTDMDINNVRTLIFINGDMWWDLVGTATYEIPKGSGKTSLFAGAIWVGGLANGTTLKMAAQTYRQSGSDFWPGPMDTTTVDISPDQCNYYDRHWKITREEVEQFVQYYADVINNGGQLDESLVPEAIKSWPGNGDDQNLHQGHYLAPFVENASDSNHLPNGIYEWRNGDYPGYVLSGPPNCSDVLLGDQTLWWVFNDVGNVHDETGGATIGLEVRAQAFAFATLDEINNMTFYKFQIINRSTSPLQQTYFGAWVDPDLGNFSDDYVGCDVGRGLGYCYNGDAIDEGVQGYGANPPCVGYDFFEGPLADSADGIDNNRNGVIDEAGEKIIMSKFVYYDNDFTDFGNPESAEDYYNYLKGIWKNQAPMTYGGNGHNGTDTCNFMFPGDSDPTGWGTNGVPQPPWDEYTAGNTPADRRFLQSAGPFTLKAGAVNYITTGAVWARATSGGQLASISLVKLADDKAQALFDNCFAIVNGPDAPDMSIRELENELIFSLSNPATSNNYKEEYRERDPYIHIKPDTQYVFQGYQIFQLKDETVSITDIHDNDKARLVAQCDIADGIGKIVNQYFNGELAVYEPVLEVSDNGNLDKGLSHTFRITTDLFAAGDNKLINHKTYYYTVIAYGYCSAESNFDPYDPEDGQNQPYKAGRRRIKTYTAIPHAIAPEAGGMSLNSVYGSGPEITRLEGRGNGFNYGGSRLTPDLTEGTVDAILRDTFSLHPTYVGSRGPIDVRIYDPVKVQKGRFELWLTGTADTNRWVLKNMDTQQIDSSVKSLEFPYDQLFTNFGMLVSINQVGSPMYSDATNNGALEATMEFADPNQRWLTGLPDIDLSPFNWILSGNNVAGDAKPLDIQDADPTQVFEKMLGGTWAPYYLVAHPVNGGAAAAIAPGEGTTATNSFTLQKQEALYQKLSSVDVVITSDKSKWTRCPVIEMQTTPSFAIGGAKRGALRKSPSKDVDGNDISGSTGMGYFPGYAINVETGERLNMAFGEDSNLPDENGTDMLWNPTSDYTYSGEYVAGGKHAIYIFGHYGNGISDVPRYDGGAFLESKLANPNATILRQTWKNCMWTGYPMLASGQQLMATDVKIRLRVTNTYAPYVTSATPVNNNNPYYSFSLDDLIATRNSPEVAKSALDLINVVPNPYYAYSTYERNQLDNRIKIVNLPAKSEITIYSVSGTVVRRLRSSSNADNTGGGSLPDPNLETSVDWDLKNSAGIPVASGVYIIHVNVPGVGEKTVKWFGVMRPIDLDTF